MKESPSFIMSLVETENSFEIKKVVHCKVPENSGTTEPQLSRNWGPNQK